MKEFFFVLLSLLGISSFLFPPSLYAETSVLSTEQVSKSNSSFPVIYPPNHLDNRSTSQQVYEQGLPREKSLSLLFIAEGYLGVGIVFYLLESIISLFTLWRQSAYKLFPKRGKFVYFGDYL